VATEKAKIKVQKLADDIQSVTLTSDQYSVTVIPELGAKITSILNRKTKREFLSRTSIEYRRREYGDAFEN